MTWPTMAQIEREAILDSLKHAKGNIQQAADLLKISRATIYRKLKEYGFRIDRSEKVLIEVPRECPEQNSL